MASGFSIQHETRECGCVEEFEEWWSDHRMDEKRNIRIVEYCAKHDPENRAK
ncbi:hypothetical protein M2444_006782 [Paenibacillus sp. PastF-3]|uniref:hypothetical protein n=1 Tax=Paenibacillus sp. PastF-3 TaxID=2940626 RepID=UPI0024760BC2|nr:hypothetical protein [Paenibacillus sp. PastF-3]MDH6374918.1 hypothetical protein [Paenibacillus sp. PastF-3]